MSLTFGGIPSPSPSYPQEVQNVSGSVNVKVRTKNIFNKDDTIISSYRASGSVLETGVRATTTQTATSSYIAYKIGGSELLGKNLTLKTTMTASSNNIPIVRLFYGTDSKVYDTEIGHLSSSGTLSVTIANAFPGSNNGIYVLLYATYNNSQDEGVYVDYTNLQIEEGTTATSYQAYGSQNVTLQLPNGMELCKIGDYQDSFVKQNGTWYKKTLVRHIELAIADMNNDENYPGWTDQTQMKIDYPNKNNLLNTITDYKCNIGVQGKYTSAEPKDLVMINTLGNGKIMLNKNVYNLNQTQMKTNYPNLIFKLYYGLQTPDMVEITDTTLLTQLDNLSNLYSYNNQTNISQTSSGLPFILDISCLRKE